MTNDFKQKLHEIRTKLPSLMKRIPGIVKVEGLDFIHDNFDRQGFANAPGSVQKWAARKAPKQIWKKRGTTGKNSSKLQPTKAGASHLKDQDKTRSLLVKSGALRRSWDQETKATSNQVAFTSSLPYAQVHNDGGKAGRGAGFTMSKRQMIGDSSELDRRIGEKIDALMNTLLQD